jgi:hypothetical protein
LADGTKLDVSQIMNGQFGFGAADVLTGTSEGDFLSAGNGKTTLYSPCFQSVAKNPTWMDIQTGDVHVYHPYFECSEPADQPAKSKGKIVIGPNARDVLMLGGPQGEVTWSDQPAADGKPKRNRWLYRREN